MYPNNQHSDSYRLSTQQHVSLDKHQQMIDDALRWQQLDHADETQQQLSPIAMLRPIFATILNIFVR